MGGSMAPLCVCVWWKQVLIFSGCGCYFVILFFRPAGRVISWALTIYLHCPTLAPLVQGPPEVRPGLLIGATSLTILGWITLAACPWPLMLGQGNWLIAPLTDMWPLLSHVIGGQHQCFHGHWRSYWKGWASIEFLGLLFSLHLYAAWAQDMTEVAQMCHQCYLGRWLQWKLNLKNQEKTFTLWSNIGLWGEGKLQLVRKRSLTKSLW